VRTSSVNTTSGFASTISLFRLKHYHRAIALLFASSGTAWEFMLPDEDVHFSAVRVTVRELGSQRGAEASVLVPWDAYVRTRDWLRCLPDGWSSAADIQPALSVLCDQFVPIVSALSL
jgi:hypothetical protein